MKLQRLLSLTRQAVDEFQMIEEGDKIAVGISGGKDSLTLLYALSYLQRFYPKHFTIEAITVHPGYEGFDLSPVQALCDELEVPYTIVHTQISGILFEARKETHPCALCAKLRKGAFNEKALELGCNKIAYAHHKNDVVETFMMSLIMEGRIYTFSPVTHLDRTGLTLIRPLIFVEEPEVKGFMKKYQLPVVKNPCPVDGYTQRQYMKELLANLNRDHHGALNRIFTAIMNGGLPDWVMAREGGRLTGSMDGAGYLAADHGDRLHGREDAK